jgi:hypothetical protein
LIFIDSPPTPGTTFTILTDAYFDPVIGELLSHFQSDRRSLQIARMAMSKTRPTCFHEHQRSPVP